MASKLRLPAKNLADPVNIGNPFEMTIREFAEEVLRLTGAKSKLTFHPLPVDDPKTRQPDITRAREILGWEPQVALADGLAKTVDYFKNLLAATA